MCCDILSRLFVGTYLGCQTFKISACFWISVTSRPYFVHGYLGPYTPVSEHLIHPQQQRWRRVSLSRRTDAAWVLDVFFLSLQLFDRWDSLRFVCTSPQDAIIVSWNNVWNPAFLFGMRDVFNKRVIVYKTLPVESLKICTILVFYWWMKSLNIENTPFKCLSVYTWLSLPSRPPPAWDLLTSVPFSFYYLRFSSYIFSQKNLNRCQGQES